MPNSSLNGWKNCWIIMQKEVLDAVRDKRALRLAFLPPVYMVLFFGLAIGFMIHFHDNEKRDITLTVSGSERAPALMSWLTEQQIKLEFTSADAYAEVEAGNLDYALIIPTRAQPIDSDQTGDKSPNRHQDNPLEPFEAWLVYNASNQTVHGDLGQVRQLIYQFNHTEASIRALARGLSPQVINPVSVRESNVASEQQMGGLVLGGVPLLLLMCVMLASMGFSADITAGERERRSLESLLINPASSLQLMAGKWLAGLLLTVMVLLLCLILLGAVLYLLPFNKIGLRVAVDAFALSSIFGALMPVAILAVALQLLLGILSRSFKDAQTYMGFLLILPMAPFFITITNPGLFEPWHLWVPLLGHQSVLRGLLLGETVPDLAYLAFWASSLPMTLLVLWVAALQLRRAKIIYS